MTNIVDFLVRLLGFWLSFIVKFNQWNNNKYLLIYFVDQKSFLITTKIVFFSCSINVNSSWLLVEVEFIVELENYIFMALFWLCKSIISLFDRSSFYSWKNCLFIISCIQLNKVWTWYWYTNNKLIMKTIKHMSLFLIPKKFKIYASIWNKNHCM